MTTHLIEEVEFCLVRNFSSNKELALQQAENAVKEIIKKSGPMIVIHHSPNDMTRDSAILLKKALSKKGARPFKLLAIPEMENGLLSEGLVEEKIKKTKFFCNIFVCFGKEITDYSEVKLDRGQVFFLKKTLY